MSEHSPAGSPPPLARTRAREVELLDSSSSRIAVVVEKEEEKKIFRTRQATPIYWERQATPIHWECHIPPAATPPTKVIRSHPTAKRVLTFAERKSTAGQPEDELEQMGFYGTPTHGDRDQEEREAAPNTFRRGHFFILVATDVAARGLDVEGIDIVVNYDMPNSMDAYAHRIGRTGRGGRKGLAVSLGGEEKA